MKEMKEIMAMANLNEMEIASIMRNENNVSRNIKSKHSIIKAIK